MKIGELARESGLAPSRIRFYERQGLIGSIDRGLNGYRQYSRGPDEILEIIVMAQQAGFSLDEIRNLVPPHGKGTGAAIRCWPRSRPRWSRSRPCAAACPKRRPGSRLVIARLEATPPGGDCFANAEGILADLRDQSKAG